MNTITLGQIVKTFTTRKGNEAVIRYPKMVDLDVIWKYINTISKEDTFINFSGEEISYDEESAFMEKVVKQIEEGDLVYLCCFIDDTLAGVTGIERNTTHRKRSLHVGTFGLTIAKEYRGEGIGHELMQTALEEAKKLDGIKIVELYVFGCNKIAQNLYKNMGFKEGGRIPGYYLHKGVFVDGIHMYKEV